MKKTTILSVRAVLWPFMNKDKRARNKDKGTKLKAYLLIALLLGVFAIPLKAQEIKTLRVGDKVPESFWQLQHHIYEKGKSSKRALNNYKGKAIILDFWASWCASCISGFPKLDSMARGLEDKLKVIKVSYEPKELVQKVFDRDLAGGAEASFEHSTIYADTYLRALFPNKLLPHYVWLNTEGRVAAITTARDLTKVNLQLLLNGKTDFLLEKADQDLTKPLFLSADLPTHNQLKSYSIFFKGMFDGLSQGVKNHLNEKGELVGKTITNLPLVELYEAAAISGLFNKMGMPYATKLRYIELAEPNLVAKDYSQARNFPLANYYSISKRFETPINEGLEELMLEELNRSSGYHGRLERRMVSCLVLKTIANPKGSVPRPLQNDKAQIDAAATKTTAQAYTIKQLINRLNIMPQISPLVLDGTGMANAVKLNLAITANLTSVREALQQQNLILVAENRELLVFVLGKQEQHVVNSNKL